jgi:hypothetical protein
LGDGVGTGTGNNCEVEGDRLVGHCRGDAFQMPMYFCFLAGPQEQGLSLVGGGRDRYEFDSVLTEARGIPFPGAAGLRPWASVLRERYPRRQEFNGRAAFVVGKYFRLVRGEIAPIPERPIIFKR